MKTRNTAPVVEHALSRVLFYATSKAFNTGLRLIIYLFIYFTYAGLSHLENNTVYGSLKAMCQEKYINLQNLSRTK